MKKIAIVGGGLAGLAVAESFLSKGGASVTLFEKVKIGGGASGVSIGLLNPFIGPNLAPSVDWKEAMESSKGLIKKVEAFAKGPLALSLPLYKLPWKDNQESIFRERALQFPEDLSFIERPLFYHKEHPFGLKIKVGLALPMGLYLQKLFEFCLFLGLHFENRELSLEEEAAFDLIIEAKGASLDCELIKGFGLKKMKGQIITLLLPKDLPVERAVVMGDIHLAPGSGQELRIGSTYEHGDYDPAPNLQRALDYLRPKVKKYLPEFDRCEIIDCVAGERLAPLSGHMPIIEKIDDRKWFVGALGSRGLLYHSALAKKLLEKVGS